MKLKTCCLPLLFGFLVQNACSKPPAASDADSGSGEKLGQLTVENAGFEQSGGEQTVPGWSVFQHAGDPSYLIAVDKKSPGKGKQSLRMTQIQPQFYGLLEQQIDVTPQMLGKTVELSALVKTSKVGENGWVVWMYSYDLGDHLLGDHESKPLVGTTKWQRVMVAGKIPTNAKTIKFGAQMKDQGNNGIGWVDDVQLRMVEPDANPKP